MKQRFLKIGAWMLWGLVVFIGALRLHFPKSEIVEGLPYMVEAASGGEWALDIGDAGLLWMANGASVEDVTLYSVERPTPRRRGRKGRSNRDNAEDPTEEVVNSGPSLRTFLNIDRGEASVSLASLLFGDSVEIDYSVDLHGGTLAGTYGQATEFFDLQWESTPLDIAELPLELPGLFSIDGTGQFLTSGSLKRFPNQVQKDTGTFSFSFPGLVAETLTFSFSGIDANVYDATFSEALITGSIENGRIEIEEANLISDKVALTLSGQMTMNNRDMDTWRVRFEMTMNPLDPDFQQILNFAPPSFKSAEGEDGTFYFVCAGNWGSIACNPDRTVVEGPEPSSTTSRSSSTRRSSSRRSSSSRTQDTRADDDDRESDSDREDAEARRRERLENIRERREQRVREREEERNRDDMDDMDDMDDRPGPPPDMVLPDDFPDRHPEDEFEDEEYFIDDLGPDGEEDDY